MGVEYHIRGEISVDELSELLSSSGEKSWAQDWSAVLGRSLTWITARESGRLVGFVRVASDGGAHAFLLDPTVDASMRRRGIGTALVRLATDAARASGAEWLHVDYEPQLAAFYSGCGFRPTQAGLIRLRD